MPEGAFPDWNELYRRERPDRMPWYSPTLDRDLRAALEKEKPREKAILTFGEGPGTQAIALAKMGYQVTATDISGAAVAQARKRAAAEHVTVDFIVDDIARTQLKKQFPLAFDRGCFHVLPPAQREAYVKNVSRLLAPRGLLFLKTFSRKEKRPGPHRFRPAELAGIFKRGFAMESVRESVFEGTLDPPPKALFAVMRKL